MAFFSIGVDLGGTNLRIAAVDEQGTLLEKLTTGTQVQRGREHVIGEMTDAIKSLVLKFKNKGELAGIGIGVPGFIDMDHGIIRESPNLPGWAEFPVRDDIERRLGTKVILENDANSAAMGEKWLGAGRDYDDICMLTLGTGVGGGLVLNGLLWHGMKGMAGELGHTTAFPDGIHCGCGNNGCVELYASATGVMRMAREAIANGTAPELEAASRGNVEFSSKIVYQMAIQGDKTAQQIYNTMGKALGIVLANMVNILNLPMYVLGGGVASAWDAFSPAMFAEMKQRSFMYKITAPDYVKPGDTKKTIVTRALLGSDAGLYGAARLPMLANPAVTANAVR